ncbi:bifunctional 2-polyprenyl-6-hydroxyphenol methylase/3-demethylubiquinol 3-O-methyltransferase UbiG [Streptomyces sp. DH8]|uniref:class I SAM-dependent methyltransferase n=1 Tax=Streptomyces sp. DH8 TaxID=2857008 RepID=UPI001E372402|nr:class I SAM-dependent methyltransferase [Streptomyces sp. DH8]
MSPSLVREGYAGTGPGAITPDGCAVELYRRLAVGDEPDVIAGVAPAGADLLELGCGAGRVTHPLVERGFRVTAVDESPEMLEQITGARTVRSPIESLDLGGERFDVVLLGSFLVHAGEHRVRDGMLRVCRTHVRDDGIVLVQREGVAHRSALPWERTDASGCLIRIVSADPVGDGVRSVRAEYRFDDARWTQTFLSRELSDEELAGHLAAAGLAVERTLTEDGTWLLARPVL